MIPSTGICSKTTTTTPTTLTLALVQQKDGMLIGCKISHVHMYNAMHNVIIIVCSLVLATSIIINIILFFAGVIICRKHRRINPITKTGYSTSFMYVMYMSMCSKISNMNLYYVQYEVFNLKVN